MDKQVADYIKGQKSPQREILIKVRKLILKALPGCGEEMRWGVPVFADGKFYIAAMKTRVHLGFSVSGLGKDEIGLFEGSGKLMRHIKIDSIDFDEKKLAKLIKMVAKKSSCKGC